jgi:hypothetical protein
MILDYHMIRKEYDFDFNMSKLEFEREIKMS